MAPCHHEHGLARGAHRISKDILFGYIYKLSYLMQICIALAAVLLKLHMKLAGSLVWPDPTQTTRVGAHLSKLGPYTGNWAKSGG